MQEPMNFSELHQLHFREIGRKIMEEMGFSGYYESDVGKVEHSRNGITAKTRTEFENGVSKIVERLDLEIIRKDNVDGTIVKVNYALDFDWMESSFTEIFDDSICFVNIAGKIVESIRARIHSDTFKLPGHPEWDEKVDG